MLFSKLKAVHAANEVHFCSHSATELAEAPSATTIPKARILLRRSKLHVETDRGSAADPPAASASAFALRSSSALTAASRCCSASAALRFASASAAAAAGAA